MPEETCAFYALISHVNGQNKNRWKWVKEDDGDAARNQFLEKAQKLAGRHRSEMATLLARGQHDEFRDFPNKMTLEALKDSNTRLGLCGR